MAGKRQKVTPFQMVEWDQLRQIVKVLEPCTVHQVTKAAKLPLARVDEQLILMSRARDLRLHRIESEPFDRFVFTLPDTELNSVF